MANALKTVSIIAKESLRLLENNLVAAKIFNRGYEEDFAKRVNGYNVGDTVTIKRNTQFTVVDGATLGSVQDITQGSTTLTLDKRKHVPFQLTTKELTTDFNIDRLSEDVLAPAMIQLANIIETDTLALYKQVPSWVGTPGQVINSFDDFAAAGERLDVMAVPMNDRNAILSPRDKRGMASQQTALYIQGAAQDAYRKGKLGEIDGTDTYMAQNVQTHVVGVATGTPAVNGAAQVSTYAAVKDTWTQTLVTDGWTNSTTGILLEGDVFTIAGVYDVNPVSRATLTHLKQFVVRADANSGASTGPATLTISPPIITSGAFQNVSAAPADNALLTVLGTGGVGYSQNIFAHRDAFAMACVPLYLPEDGVVSSRATHKNFSIRIAKQYSISTDATIWRADVLYGVKAIQPWLATRGSGTA